MIVDILCKVVDNFGDIGVVWRLAKALKAARPGLELRIIVDDLAAFSAIHPGINPRLTRQSDPIARIVRWDKPDPQLSERRAKLCIETFACGRPDWYDAILHDPANPRPRLHISLEYLSAEAYPGEFHLLPSLSPIPQVNKIFFMPGFDSGTGGLILDPAFTRAKSEWTQARAENRLVASRELYMPQWFPASGKLTDSAATATQFGTAVNPPDSAAFWLLLFAYEHDYSPLVRDLAVWSQTRSADSPKPAVLMADCPAAIGFFQAWKKAGQPFPAHALPFLSQEAWDQLLLASDFAIIRGEESLARAALGGQPFLWHAYLQAEGYQQVKADALVERIGRHFSPGPAWTAWSDLMTAFNRRTANSTWLPGQEQYLPVLDRLADLRPGFMAFAESLEKLGDCATALLSLSDRMG